MGNIMFWGMLGTPCLCVKISEVIDAHVFLSIVLVMIVLAVAHVGRVQYCEGCPAKAHHVIVSRNHVPVFSNTLAGCNAQSSPDLDTPRNATFLAIASLNSLRLAMPVLDCCGRA